MRNEQPSVPQPQPRQQMGLNDMQLWQQQLMYKQLQELQRQHQRQQLDQHAKQQDSLNQLSGAAKQSSDQLPTLLNGAPVYDATNYWARELVGGDSKKPPTSQIYTVGNMNWVQHSGATSVQASPNNLIFSQDQGQALSSVGFAPQQFDQSLYGAPVPGSRGSLSQYSHFQGIAHGSSDMSTKLGGNEVEKQIVQPVPFNSFQLARSPIFPDQLCTQDSTSLAKQVFHEKNLFGHVPAQTLPNGTTSRNFHQANQLLTNAEVQEFLGRKDGDSWMGNLQEKAVAQVVPSQGLVSLDPTEEKILFGSDDGIWGASFGRTDGMTEGGYLHGKQVEGTTHFNAFPSVQSGSWSALMQSAVAEASSDTGPQDELSGLSFQKPELSTGNHPAALGDSVKQPTTWIDNNSQTASSVASRSLPLFDDVNMSPGHRSIRFEQRNVEYTFEETDRVRMHVSCESLQRLPKEASKPCIERNLQVKTSSHLEKISEGSSGQIHEQSQRTADSRDMESNTQNMHVADPQSLSSYNTSHQSFHRTNNWKINESLSPNGDATMRTYDPQNHVESNDNKQAMPMERDHDGGMWKIDSDLRDTSFRNTTSGSEQLKSGRGRPQVHDDTALRNSSTFEINQETNQQVLHDDKIDYRSHLIVDSSEKYDGTESVGDYPRQLIKGPQAQSSFVDNPYMISGETEILEKKEGSCNQKEISDVYSSGHSHAIQHAITRGWAGENVWLGGSESHHLVGSNQKSDGQVGRRSSGPHKFQYHPMGNLEVNVEPADHRKHVSHSQGPSQTATGVLESAEQGYYGQLRFVDNYVLDKHTDTAKEHLPDLFRYAKGEDMPSEGVNPGSHESIRSASFRRSGSSDTSNRTVQPSQNMLELLNKVDQSSEGNATTHFDSSENKASVIHARVASTASVTHHQSQSSAFQGFGLQLAPPSERLSCTNPAFSSQTSSQMVDDDNSGHLGLKEGEEGQTQSLTTSSMQSVPPVDETCQREYNQSTISGQAGIDTSHSNIHGNSFPTVMPGKHYQQKEQHVSSASGQTDLNGHVNLASCYRQAHDSNDGAADRSPRASLPDSCGRIPPFNLASPVDTCRLVASAQSYSSSTGLSQGINPSSSERHLPVSNPPITLGISQQGAFSSKSHNVWTKVSTQKHLSGGPSNNVLSSFFQPIHLSTNSLEATSWASQKADNESVEARNGPSESVSCSVDAQQFVYREGQPVKDSSMQEMPLRRIDLASGKGYACQGQEPVAKNLSDVTCSASSSLAVHPDHRRRGEDGQEAQHASGFTSDLDIEAFGHSMKPSNALHQNYSLLHQVQAMKEAETDPTRVKRHKGSDLSAGAQQMVARTGQHFAYGRTITDRVGNELSVSAQKSLYALSDSKMLRFSSGRNEELVASASFQPHIQNQHPNDMGLTEQNEPKSSSNHPSTTSTPLLRVNEQPHINPQMALSWSEKYRIYKNGQNLAMHDELDSSKRHAELASQKFFGKTSGTLLHAVPGIEQANTGNANEVGSFWQSPLSTPAAKEQLFIPHRLPLDDVEVAVRSRKRKSLASELPWHKEDSHSSQRIQSISMAELDWAQASNRKIEKVDDDVEMLEDVVSMPQPRRRLILTTQLMQQLFRSVPAAVLSAEATSGYESVTYFSAKLALGDGCNLISCSGIDSHVHPSCRNMSSERHRASERAVVQFLSKVVEDFIDRVRKLESDFLRLEKRASILDIRVECQDLERFSILNHFARFHGRGNPSEGTGSSSSSGTTIQRTYPQRYVTALAMPRNLPERVLCLSL